MLECRNGSYYTGYTVDILKRYSRHRSGKGGARFTRSFRVKGIVQCWQVKGTRGDAMRIEHFIKSMDRAAKDKIVVDPLVLKKEVRKKFALSVRPFDPVRVHRAWEAEFAAKRG